MRRIVRTFEEKHNDSDELRGRVMSAFLFFFSKYFLGARTAIKRVVKITDKNY